jgi:glyoxylase-like metal-dependent hydrolase (beta-lactamase superfamily II)
MKIAPGVEMLELQAELVNGPGTLYPALLVDNNEAILVDAGLPNMLSLFVEAMAQAGIPLEKLTRIIITHHDLDHIGSLGELQRAARQRIEVLSHAEEVPYIQGERLPIKMTPAMLAQMEEQMKSMPEERRKATHAMMESIKNQKVKVDRTLGDGEELPFCGGLRILHTPGHTPGHICLYLKTSRTLITGDALFIENGKLVPAPSFFNADTPLAMASLKKLTHYDIANVVAYHGGLFQNDPNRSIAAICASF